MEYTHVKALRNIKDDSHIYCRKGTIYEVLNDEGDGTLEVYCEQKSNDDLSAMLCIYIDIKDPDFEFLVMEDDVDEN